MPCDDPDFCLGDHIRPWLDDFTLNSTTGQGSARCPAHEDRKASLSIRVGDRGIIVWHCHAECSDADVWAAMVRRGVPDSCLRQVAAQRTEDELVSALTVVLQCEPPGRVRDLLIAAIVWNRGKMPRGRALAALAKRAGISRATAYRATGERERITVSPRDERIVSPRDERLTVTLNVRPLTSDIRRNRSAGVSTAVEGEVPRRCESCEREISAVRRGTRYCGAACRAKAWRAARQSRRAS